MPTTRSQAAEDKARVYEDSPASPSVRTSGYDTHVRVGGYTVPSNVTAIETQTSRPTRVNVGAVDARSSRGSVRSNRSSASAVARIRQAELDAEEQLAEIRRQELQIQAQMVKKRLAADVATIREETDRESLCAEELTDTNCRVTDWLQRTRTPVRGEGERMPEPEQASLQPPPLATQPQPRESRPTVQNRATVGAELHQSSPMRNQSRDRGIERLAGVLERMTSNKTSPRHLQDLPMFSGDITDWLPLKAAMQESTSTYKYSPAENLTRLRACLRGEAKQAVSALLYTASDPAVIMNTLEQCYGRPEVIIDHALEEIKKLPRIGSTAAEINSFAIKLQNTVTVIAAIDERGYLQNPMLARQVTEKLSPHMKSKWCDYAEESGRRHVPEILTMSRFLMREADRAVRHAYTTGASVTFKSNAANIKPEPAVRRVNERNRSARVYSTTEDARATACYCCGSEHKTSQCTKLKDMPMNDRWAWAKEARVCFLCLDSKHRRMKCKARKCGVEECRRSHHALLHYTPSSVENVLAASAHRPESDGQVLLKVCPIVLTKQGGGTVRTFALLDEGSTITLVDEEIAKLVGARGTKKALNIQGVTSLQKEADSEAIEVAIRGESQTNEFVIKARTVRNLTLGRQSLEPKLLQQRYLRDIRPDDVCYADAKPRVLIGADNWHLIVSRRLLARGHNEPAASLTRLGWVIHGKVPRSSITEAKESVLHIRGSQEVTRERDDELSALVKAHFDIDALGIRQICKPNAKNERARAIIDRTLRRVNGRFEVGLPWASDSVNLPPSYDMAARRLKTIEKKMDTSPEFATAYTAQIRGLLDKGYAEKCGPDHVETANTWYLPHFAVTNPNKPGKVRMVFDAAARANGTCLNDALLDGPDLLCSLQGVLFRFREKSVAVTADIREMFLQVKIRPADRAAQHFLWRGSDRSKPIDKYVMTSMIFGARSSPFIAHSVKNKNAEELKTTYPLAYTAITVNHYMDDWVQSFDTVAEARQTMQEVIHVHRNAGFELAGWSSNNEEIFKESHMDTARSPKELGATANNFGKTLGVLWLPQTDELAFNTARHRVPEAVKTQERTPTKREALSAVMSIFDPLGLISPYTITAKIMLQGLWREKTGWDDLLPIEESSTFSEWQSDLEYIDALRLQRVYNTKESARRELHVFCDASEQAYAAAAYWRYVNADGSITVTLVAGKAKVAPMKAQSIPRLELQAGLIGARLAAEINKEHIREVPDVTYWSDSKTVLQWIRSDSVRYTPYVAHRLGEIAELTEPQQWRWVPTAQNVADDATRSGNTRMQSDDRWFVGPTFLYDSEDRWPIETQHVTSSETEKVLTLQEAGMKAPLIELGRFSSYERAKRAVGYALAFIDACRQRSRGLTAAHLRRAESICIGESQRESFPAEIARLAAGNNVERSSRLAKLDATYGDDGVVRMNGRINAAAVPAEMKKPAVLSGAHHLTKLIIKNEHEKNHHIGREHIVNNIRQRYWVLRLRPAVKQVLRECAVCRIKRTAPVVPVKGDLPGDRLKAYTRPFSRSGIDCFGPMTVAVGRRREKRWGLIVTCLVTRAIHIEVVATLSTDSAVMALRRMAARRGWPEVIWSDNGTNFRGANMELEKAYREWLPALQDYVLTRRTVWKFTDPGAPNQGGAWERLIRSVKAALAVTLRERAPREEILTTALAEIEHTVNSRPLTYVTAEPSDAEALTPNHFLLGSATGLPYVGECQAADKRTWRAAQALANMFWARWMREYLPTLIPRGEVRARSQPHVKVGDIVVIADGLLPRNVWPKGRITKTFPGPDGVTRSAEIATRGGTFRRPARRLIVLPIEDIGYEDSSPRGGC